MLHIDAHHHLWDLTLNKHRWLLDQGPEDFLGDLTAIRRSYLESDYQRDTAQQFSKSIHVQAGWDSWDALAESQWLYDLHQQSSHLAAIVAFADLSQGDPNTVLEQQAAIPIVRGIRQIVAWSETPALNHCPTNHLENPLWRKHFSALKKYDLVFDLQIYPEQTDAAYTLAKHNPDIKIVIEHGLQPLRSDEVYLHFWQQQLKKLAQLPNIFIKLSGFSMFHKNLDVELLRRLILTIVECFSADRCMIGTNFPVDTLFIKAEAWWPLYMAAIADFSSSEQTYLLGKSAQIFYKLDE